MVELINNGILQVLWSSADIAKASLSSTLTIGINYGKDFRRSTNMYKVACIATVVYFTHLQTALPYK